MIDTVSVEIGLKICKIGTGNKNTCSAYQLNKRETFTFEMGMGKIYSNNYFRNPKWVKEESWLIDLITMFISKFELSSKNFIV